jgi:hypothetical protein
VRMIDDGRWFRCVCSRIDKNTKEYKSVFVLENLFRFILI